MNSGSGGQPIDASVSSNSCCMPAHCACMFRCMAMLRARPSEVEEGGMPEPKKAVSTLVAASAVMPIVITGGRASRGPSSIGTVPAKTVSTRMASAGNSPRIRSSPAFWPSMVRHRCFRPSSSFSGPRSASW